MIRAANANLQVRRFEQIEVLNLVRAQVAEAYARTHARYAQIETNESAIRSGLLSFTQDLTRIRYRSRDVLPIELLDSFRLMAGARIDYIDAIVDYNRAQFELYVALGQPPANAPGASGTDPGRRSQRRDGRNANPSSGQPPPPSPHLPRECYRARRVLPSC